MKKTIKLDHPKIKYPRMIEGAKNEVRKYIKRERRKELPEGADYWDFDCKFGFTEAEAKPVHEKEICKLIDEVKTRALTSFYVEILRKPAQRHKTKPEETAE